MPVSHAGFSSTGLLCFSCLGFLFYFFREPGPIDDKAFVGAFAYDVHPIIRFYLKDQTPTINLGELHFCDDFQAGRLVGGYFLPPALRGGLPSLNSARSCLRNSWVSLCP